MTYPVSSYYQLPGGAYAHKAAPRAVRRMSPAGVRAYLRGAA